MNHIETMVLQEERASARETSAPSVLFYLVSPVIYSMIIPATVLDLFITIYQHICFRAYGIERVKRSDYIALDRHRLKYLQPLQRVNCNYCAYFNGVIAYAREVASRTEQYFCPIRHAARPKGLHSRHANFLPYGDDRNVKVRIQRLRNEVKTMPR